MRDNPQDGTGTIFGRTRGVWDVLHALILSYSSSLGLKLAKYGFCFFQAEKARNMSRDELNQRIKILAQKWASIIAIYLH